jgi:hypothetical protein
MTISDKEYNKISDAAYWLDPAHKNYSPEITEGSIQKFSGKEYRILKIQENSDSDGMQAMLFKSFSK